MQHRYVGRTDEPLCQQGKSELGKFSPMPTVDRVFVSPMLRCQETAQILFPGHTIEEMGELPFPQGESRMVFQKRCNKGFCKIIEDSLGKKCDRIAIVAHGGTIMSILDEYAAEYGSYYDFQVRNGCGFETELMIDFHLRICYSIENGTYVPYKSKGDGTDT